MGAIDVSVGDRPRSAWLWSGLSRGEILAGLCAIGFANGTVGRIQSAVAHDGFAAAVLGTFGISAVVWVAFTVCPMLFLRAPRTAPSMLDLTMAAGALAAFLMPFSPLSWLVLTGLAVYILADRGSPTMHSAGWILLATTGSMLWGGVLLMTANGPILAADAVLIGWLTGSEQIGNTVRFVGAEGYVWITPACSSLANVSQAMLCWTLFAQLRGVRGVLPNIGWCLTACLAVVSINAVRISLMVLHPAYFDLIHGPTGNAIASWTSVLATVGICAVGTCHPRLAVGQASLQPLEHAIPVSRWLGIYVVCLLTLSIGIKLATGASWHSADPLVVSAHAGEEQVTALLERHGFRTEIQKMEQLPLVMAEAGDCHLLVALVAPQGWHRALVRQFGNPSDRVFFVIGGATYPEQSVLLTWAPHYWRVLNRYVGRVIAAAPVLGVVASPACNLPDGMWQEIG